MTTRPLARPSVPDPPPAVRLRDPAGVVAAVPYLLGFAPQRSLVVIGIDDEESVGPTLRCDYDPGLRPAGLTLLWQHIGRVMARNGCGAVLVVAYTDADPADFGADSGADLLAVLLGDTREDAGAENDLGDAGSDLDTDGDDRPGVLDVLVVGPTRFRSLACTDDTCCPPDGLPVADVTAHPVAATFVLAGRSPAADRDSVEPEETVDDDELRTARRAATRARATPAADVHELLRRWTACLPDGPSAQLAGELGVAWRRDGRLRDACLAVLLPGGAAAAQAVLEPAPGGAAAAGDLGKRLSDPACAQAAARGAPVLRRLAALATGQERATVLAAHAWLSWVAGDGTAADVLTGRALALDDSQPLARLVQQCLGHGLGAPWTTAAQLRASR